MKARKLIWQIYPAQVAILAVSIVIAIWYATASLRNSYYRQVEGDLEARARLLAPWIVAFLQKEDRQGLQSYCVETGRGSGTRITVVAADGAVLADSAESPYRMGNHRNRGEIAAAFTGQVGRSRRYSSILKEDRIYVAIPLSIADRSNREEPAAAIERRAVLRTSVPLAVLEKTFVRMRLRILFGGVAGALLASLITLFMFRKIGRPLEQMTKNARRFAVGDFAERMLPITGRSASREIVTLASSMDRMARLLDEKIQAIVSHKNQLETVFSSMIEAVVAIDNDERIIRMNEAAAELFAVDKTSAVGRVFQQIVRNVKLQKIIDHTLKTGRAAEEEIVFYENYQKSGKRYLQTHIVPLRNGREESAGVLVVMNDITRIRLLEDMRRDFVANVSHEIRSPITSIQGYVETLLDGALEEKEKAREFLTIVERQARRLGCIVNDLLSLSRIEEDARKGGIQRTSSNLLPVLQSALQACQLKADAARVRLSFVCAENICFSINPVLLEQALVNLIVNAIRYSKEGDTVSVTVEESGQAEGRSVILSVSDTGCGIAKEHLSRIFERFYRSDKARSRAAGGTGLGLAIVKHIAQSHGGTVEVESSEGFGATFRIILKEPQAN